MPLEPLLDKLESLVSIAGQIWLELELAKYVHDRHHVVGVVVDNQNFSHRVLFTLINISSEVVQQLWCLLYVCVSISCLCLFLNDWGQKL